MSTAQANVAVAAPVAANSPEANKAAIAQQDRALKAAIMLTKENLVTAGKNAARAMTRAEQQIAKAGITLLNTFREEGESYANMVHDYDSDIKPITELAMAEAYPGNKNSQKVMRSHAKLFFIAGVHGVETEETGLNKMVESYRDQLKAAGVLKEHGNDKADKRAARTSTANEPKATVSTPTEPSAEGRAKALEIMGTSTPTVVVSGGVAIPVSNPSPQQAPVTGDYNPAGPDENMSGQIDSHVDCMQAATGCAIDSDGVAIPTEPRKYSPKTTYTDKDKRAAAMILSGSPSVAHEIVTAFATHREQVLKFIHQLLASDAANK